MSWLINTSVKWMPATNWRSPSMICSSVTAAWSRPMLRCMQSIMKLWVLRLLLRAGCSSCNPSWRRRGVPGPMGQITSQIWRVSIRSFWLNPVASLHCRHVLGRSQEDVGSWGVPAQREGNGLTQWKPKIATSCHQSGKGKILAKSPSVSHVSWHDN